MWCFAPTGPRVVLTHTPPFVMASNVHDPGATTTVLCVYVYVLWCMSVSLMPLPGLSVCMCIFLPLTLLPRLSVCMCICLPLMPLPGLSVCMCICLPLMPHPGMCCDVMPLTPIPWLTNVHNPDATSRVVCVYVCVLCVCAPDATSRALFGCSRLGPRPGLNVCLLMGEWPMRYFQPPPSSSVGFWRSRHINMYIRSTCSYRYRRSTMNLTYLLQCALSYSTWNKL